jgi:hypothetical protein
MGVSASGRASGAGGVMPGRVGGTSLGVPVKTVTPSGVIAPSGEATIKPSSPSSISVPKGGGGGRLISEGKSTSGRCSGPGSASRSGGVDVSAGAPEAVSSAGSAVPATGSANCSAGSPWRRASSTSASIRASASSVAGASAVSVPVSSAAGAVGSVVSVVVAGSVSVWVAGGGAAIGSAGAAAVVGVSVAVGAATSGSGPAAKYATQTPNATRSSKNPAVSAKPRRGPSRPLPVPPERAPKIVSASASRAFSLSVAGGRDCGTIGSVGAGFEEARSNEAADLSVATGATPAVPVFFAFVSGTAARLLAAPFAVAAG